MKTCEQFFYQEEEVTFLKKQALMQHLCEDIPYEDITRAEDEDNVFDYGDEYQFFIGTTDEVNYSLLYKIDEKIEEIIDLECDDPTRLPVDINLFKAEQYSLGAAHHLSDDGEEHIEACDGITFYLYRRY